MGEKPNEMDESQGERRTLDKSSPILDRKGSEGAAWKPSEGQEARGFIKMEGAPAIPVEDESQAAGRIDHYLKIEGRQASPPGGGDAPGIAVQDEGAGGSKPVKG